MDIPGKLDLFKLEEQVKNNHIQTVVVCFTDHYGRLLGKRFEADFFLETIARSGTHGCDYLLTTDMEMEPLPGFKFANWELGYGDFHLVPILSTLRLASWLDKTAIVHCNVMNEKTHDFVGVAPRTILANQLAKVAEMKMDILAASELEYYLFEESYKEAHSMSYHNLQPQGWYLEDYHLLQSSRTEKYHAATRQHLKKSGIPVEGTKGEWGLGQHEINIRYAEALEMADRHQFLKQCMKELADEMGMSVTFMAKYHPDRAGSSCHIHLSLWENDINIFEGQEKIGPVEGSDYFKWFLGGWMAHVNDVMPFYAPTVNSYKRYTDGSWAPTRIAWSYDNRAAGFRVVGKGKSLRIECRIPGADCNPYLAYAAAIASGLDGIRQKLLPPPIFEGDVYAARHLPSVPRSLEEAVGLFEKSDFAKTNFGADVVEHYSHFYNNEIATFRQTVTDWERKRYFERI